MEVDDQVYKLVFSSYCVSGVCIDYRNQKRVLDPLGLELKIAVQTTMCLHLDPLKEQPVLLIAEPSSRQALWCILKTRYISLNISLTFHYHKKHHERKYKFMYLKYNLSDKQLCHMN